MLWLFSRFDERSSLWGRKKRAAQWIAATGALALACGGHSDDEPVDADPPRIEAGRSDTSTSPDASIDNAGGSAGSATGGGGGGQGGSTGSGGASGGSGGSAGAMGTGGVDGAGGSTSGSGGASGRAGASGGGGAGASDGSGGTGGRDASIDEGGLKDGAGGFGGFRDEVPPQPCIPGCLPPGGGQYCGTFSDRCGKMLDCGLSCNQPGYTCGGNGQPNICGASPDSGACKRLECSQWGSTFCDVVGDGCGGSMYCGLCHGERDLTCGGGGVPNVCGAPADGSGLCKPSKACSAADTRFCGTIGDGCGNPVECGACPTGEVCGLRKPNVCGFPCRLCAQIPTCESGTTSISGVAVTAALNGAHPLSGARVYIPNLAVGASLPPTKTGAACHRCAAFDEDRVVASTTTAPDGSFTLDKVPAGNGIPLVIEIGKWRRMQSVDVAPCTNNVLPAGTARLPRNHTEGDIPLTAVVTGSHDRLQCLLRKMGVADTEFTNPAGSGRIHLYRANGARIDANTPDVSELFGTMYGSGAYERYDEILLACRGIEAAENAVMRNNMYGYVELGGRIFATHFAHMWLSPDTFNWMGGWSQGANNPPSPFLGTIDTSHARGADLAKWLEQVGALASGTPARISIAAPAAHLQWVDSASGVTSWIGSESPQTSQIATADTPALDASGDKCGRVVFSDFHTPASMSSDATFPSECDSDMTMTPEEKALEFMLLELGACQTPTNPPDTTPVPPPRPPPPPPGPIPP